MPDINFKPTPKQHLTWKYLQDQITEEALFGGGAGGAKSYLGCIWLIHQCLKYPKSRWLMGRAELKTLKETTLNTFFDVSSANDLKGFYNFNENKGLITWINGSEILLKDLAHYPSDPNYDALGSLEITGAFIDECNQIVHKCKEVVKSRIRYKLDEFGLIPKILMTCNPAKNWVYSEFYGPWKRGLLPENKKFVQALAKDNPHVSKHYITSLQALTDINIKERLLYGNWEYDDDPAKLFDFTKIQDLFSNYIEKPNKERFITCDVARKGIDKTVIAVWEDLEIIHLEEHAITTIDFVARRLDELRQKYNIPLSNTIADEDGLGGGVVDISKCVGFIGNQAPFKPLPNSNLNNKDFENITNFKNLRSQCYFKLSEIVGKNLMRINCSIEQQDLISEELGAIKEKNQDKDQKKAVISKDEIKELIGRSPDYADTLMMRMYFIVNEKPTPKARLISY